jgi:hypothetical protein
MKYAIISFLFISVLVSCKKEESPTKTDPVVDPIPQFSVSSARFKTASRFIKRELSYTRDNPLLKMVRLFSYDGAMRCSEIKLGTIDSSVSNPAFTLRQTLTLNYEGASILPTSVSSVRAVFPNLTTIFYYNYDSQGRKIRDSVRVKNTAGEPADRVINYVYKSDHVYATPVLRGFPMQNVTLDTVSLLNGGNIEQLTSKHLTSSGDRVTTYTFTYDKAINPYNKLNIANSLYFEHASLGLGYNVPLETHYMGVTTNNMTSWSSGDYVVFFRYQYGGDNYPLKKEMILPGNATPYQVTFFEY